MHIYIYQRINIHKQMYIYIHTCMYVYIQVHIYTFMHACVRVGVVVLVMSLVITCAT